jgi:catalase
VLGASRQLLTHAGVPLATDKRLAQDGTGLVVVERGQEAAGTTAFLQALAKHRHFGREMDPPPI